MNWTTLILTVLGLSVFEIITSVDNAVINAEVLATMRPKSDRTQMICRSSNAQSG